jgi:hypothetical protein
MSTARVIRVWLVLAGLMFCNGLLRFGTLDRLLPPRASGIVSGILGVIIIIGASRPFLREERPQTMADLYRVAGTWLILTMLFEAGLGMFSGLTWREMLGSYAIWEGELWPLILISVVVAPFAWLPRVATPAWRAML